MADFLDKLSDSELVDKAAQMFEAIKSAPEDFGATAGQATELDAKTDSFSTDLTAHIAAQAAAKSQTQAKDASRDALEDIIRLIVKQARLQGVSEANIAAMGVPVGESSATPSTATRPTGSVDTSQRFFHTIKFADEATPESKRLPRGVLGCEIYQKIGGAPPTDYKECQFRGLDTKSPYTWEFDAEDVGKMVHYMLRWRLRDESAGGWSETISATVTG